MDENTVWNSATFPKNLTQFLKRLTTIISPLWMSHWHQQMVDGADFWISCKWLKALKKASQWQLIKCSAPSTICWRQCDIRISMWQKKMNTHCTVICIKVKFAVTLIDGIYTFFFCRRVQFLRKSCRLSDYQKMGQRCFT